MCILGTVAFIVNVMVPINLFLTPVDEILKLTIVAIDILVAPAGSLDLSLTVLATWGSHGFLVRLPVSVLYSIRLSWCFK